ncbi:uncharacterized protein LOC144589634 [Pogona vitticeps]
MTLSLKNCRNGWSALNAANSLALRADVMATRKRTLRDNSFSEQVHDGLQRDHPEAARTQVAYKTGAAGVAAVDGFAAAAALGADFFFGADDFLDGFWTELENVPRDTRRR